MFYFSRPTMPGGGTPGVAFEVEVAIPPGVKHLMKRRFESPGDRHLKVRDAFGKPWAEVVREGSPFFPEGKMEVTATIKLLTK